MISNQRGSTAQDAPGYGVTWGGVPFHARRAMTVAAATLVVAGLAGPTAASAATTPAASSADKVSVIVRELDGAGNAPERAVSAFGGSVGRQLSIIGGFTAEVPSDRLDALRAVPGVESVTEDAGLSLQSTDVESQVDQAGSLYTIANKVTGASAMWDAGYTGKGVDVAVIDSGVVPVEGFSTRQGGLRSRPVLRGRRPRPRTSTPTATARTWPASSPVATPPRPTRSTGDSPNFVGMAPDARIVSIKVADADGSHRRLAGDRRHRLGRAAPQRRTA